MGLFLDVYTRISFFYALSQGNPVTHIMGFPVRVHQKKYMCLFYRALLQKTHIIDTQGNPVCQRLHQERECECMCVGASGMYYVGWLRLVGPLKLYVSFAKEPYKRDDNLQKRPTIFKGLIVATP